MLFIRIWKTQLTEGKYLPKEAYSLLGLLPITHLPYNLIDYLNKASFFSILRPILITVIHLGRMLALIYNNTGIWLTNSSGQKMI